jgi:hypothetical protein
LTIQAYIPPALGAVHNFIRVHDADEIHEFGDDAQDLNPGYYGDLTPGPAGTGEKTRARLKRDQIAQAMWESYQIALESGRYDVLE